MDVWMPTTDWSGSNYGLAGAVVYMVYVAVYVPWSLLW